MTTMKDVAQLAHALVEEITRDRLARSVSKPEADSLGPNDDATVGSTDPQVGQHGGPRLAKNART